MTKPLLTTQRFELWRPQGPHEVDDLCRLVADDETRRFLGPARAVPHAQWDRLMRNAGGWSLYGYGLFYVRRPGHPDIIASAGVFHSWRGLDPLIDDQPEAGWIVRRDHWGQGLAGEVMRAALAWFEAEHGRRRIVAMIASGNAVSERVAARLGFDRFGETREDDTVLNLYQRLPG